MSQHYHYDPLQNPPLHFNEQQSVKATQASLLPVHTVPPRVGSGVLFSPTVGLVVGLSVLCRNVGLGVDTSTLGKHVRFDGLPLEHRLEQQSSSFVQD